MRTLEELSTGDTTTSTTGISSLQETLFAKEVILAAEENKMYDQAVQETDAIVGTQDKAYTMFYTGSNLTLTSVGEATIRTYTQMDNLSSVAFTPSFYRYGIAISKQAVQTTNVDLLELAKTECIRYATDVVDAAIAAAFTAATVAAGTAYGGTATGTASVETGCIFTPDVFATAHGLLRAKNWRKEPAEPFMLFMSTEQETSLLKDSQFVNASEYGENTVLLSGEIGSYLGTRCIVSTNVTANTTWGGAASVAGHTLHLVKAKKCGALVWKEKYFLDSEYNKESSEYRIYEDMSFATDSLNDAAIVLIRVSDA